MSLKNKNWGISKVNYLILALLWYLMFLPLSFLPAYSELKFPAFALMTGILIWTQPYIFSKKDIPYLLFLTGCLISLVDTRNLVNSWHYLAIWFTGFAFVFWGRSFFIQQKNLILKSLQILFWLTTIYMVFWITYSKFAGWPNYKLWNQMIPWIVVGKNINVATIYPMLLFPLVLFKPNKKNKDYLKILLALILLIIIAFSFKSEMGKILLLFYGIVYITQKIPTKWLLIIISFTAIIAIVLREPLTRKFESYLDTTSLKVRLPHEKLSLKIIQQNPINGIGLGSYFYEANSYLNLPIQYYRDNKRGAWTFNTHLARNHNNMGKLLAEIGLPFWVIWLSPPFFLLLWMRKRPNKNTYLPYWVILSGFYISTITLRQSFSDYIELSEIHLIFFIAFMFISVDEKYIELKLNKPPHKMAKGLFIGAIFVWFTINFLTNHYQLKAVALAKNKEYESAIQILEPWFIPGVMETINEAEPIARHLGKWYFQLGNQEKAKYYFDEALKLAPKDPGLNYEILQIKISE